MFSSESYSSPTPCSTALLAAPLFPVAASTPSDSDSESDEVSPTAPDMPPSFLEGEPPPPPPPTSPSPSTPLLPLVVFEVRVGRLLGLPLLPLAKVGGIGAEDFAAGVLGGGVVAGDAGDAVGVWPAGEFKAGVIPSRLVAL